MLRFLLLLFAVTACAQEIPAGMHKAQVTADSPRIAEPDSTLNNDPNWQRALDTMSNRQNMQYHQSNTLNCRTTYDRWGANTRCD